MRNTYIAPGVYINPVEDTTFSNDVASTAFRSMGYIFSDKGVDGKVTLVNSVSDTIAKFGNPNAAKYGGDLGYGSMLNWLEGGLSAYVCRLTAPDAAKAELSLSLISKKTITRAALAGKNVPTPIVYPSLAVFYEPGKAYAVDTILIDVDNDMTTYVVLQDIEEFEEKKKHNANKTQEIYELKRNRAGEIINKDLKIDDLLFEIIDDTYSIVRVDSVTTRAIPAPGTPAARVLAHANRIHQDPSVKFDLVVGKGGANSPYQYGYRSTASTLPSFGELNGKTHGVSIFGQEVIALIAMRTDEIEIVVKNEILDVDTIDLIINGNTVTVTKLAAPNATLYRTNDAAAHKAIKDLEATGGSISMVARLLPAPFLITYSEIETFDLPRSYLSIAPTNTINPADTSINHCEIGAITARGTGSFYNGLFLTLTKDGGKTQDNDGTETLVFDVYEYSPSGTIVQLVDESGAGTFIEGEDKFGLSTSFENTMNRFTKSISYEDRTNLVPQLSINSILDPTKGFFVKSTELNVLSLATLGITDSLFAGRLILNGGTEGSLINPITGKVDIDVRDQLILDYYNGTIDGAITSPDSTPASFIFDMQQNPTISNAIANFCKNTREDVFAYHGGQDDVNPEETLDYSKRVFNVSSRTSSLRSGYADVVDKYSGQSLRAPMFYISKIRDLAHSIRTRGIDIVHAGYGDEGIISGFVADTDNYTPSHAYQDTFYTQKINPAIKDGTGEFFFLSTRTRQRRNSKLSNEAIVQISQVMAKENRILGRPFINRFITNTMLSEIRSTFYEHYLTQWGSSPAVKGFSVEVKATEYDKLNNSAKVFITIEFNNILEKLIITSVVR